MVQIAVYCEHAEQAALVELFFPARADERVEGIVHMPCKDDVAQYCVHITLARPVINPQQRASLLGWCSWYAYRGDPACLFGSIDLDNLETFVTWLAFQEDSVERTWSTTVLQDYACAVAVSEVSAKEWLYGQQSAAVKYRDTLPQWFFDLSERIDLERTHQRTITKVVLQQLVEAIV